MTAQQPAAEEPTEQVPAVGASPAGRDALKVMSVLPHVLLLSSALTCAVCKRNSAAASDPHEDGRQRCTCTLHFSPVRLCLTMLSVVRIRARASIVIRYGQTR